MDSRFFRLIALCAVAFGVVACASTTVRTA